MAMRQLDDKEVRAAQKRWRETFVRRLHRLTSHWVRGTDEGIFRKGYLLRFLTGADAEAEYATAPAARIIVLDEWSERGWLFVEESQQEP